MCRILTTLVPLGTGFGLIAPVEKVRLAFTILRKCFICPRLTLRQEDHWETVPNPQCPIERIIRLCFCEKLPEPKDNLESI